MLSEGNKHKICPSVGRCLTRTLTGSLPTASPSSNTFTQGKTFSRRSHSMVIWKIICANVSKTFLHRFHVFSQPFVSFRMTFELIMFHLNGELAIIWQNQSLWNLKVQYCVHKILLPAPVLNLTACTVLKVSSLLLLSHHFNIIT
jgi:hypothetical protein